VKKKNLEDITWLANSIKIYAKWGPDRKNERWWEGLTDVYGLEKFWFSTRKL